MGKSLAIDACLREGQLAVQVARFLSARCDEEAEGVRRREGWEIRLVMTPVR